MSRRPSSAALEVENLIVERATSAGQGNRRRPRQHGDIAMYQWGPTGKDRANGCRCEPCVEGTRAYKRRYARQRSARRGAGLIALAEVRPQVRRLLALGWQLQQIADHANTGTNVIRRIARTGHPDDDINRRTARAILAIPPIAPHRLHRHTIDQALLTRAADVAAGRWKPDRDAIAYGDDGRWKVAAACADLDPESMYPGRGDSFDACRALCAVCPVAEECAEVGLYERHGVWGGLSEKERRRLRRSRGIVLDDELDSAVAA